MILVILILRTLFLSLTPLLSPDELHVLKPLSRLIDLIQASEPSIVEYMASLRDSSYTKALKSCYRVVTVWAQEVSSHSDEQGLFILSLSRPVKSLCFPGCVRYAR